MLGGLKKKRDFSFEKFSAMLARVKSKIIDADRRASITARASQPLHGREAHLAQLRSFGALSSRLKTAESNLQTCRLDSNLPIIGCVCSG